MWELYDIQGHNWELNCIYVSNDSTIIYVALLGPTYRQSSIFMGFGIEMKLCIKPLNDKKEISQCHQTYLETYGMDTWKR